MLARFRSFGNSGTAGVAGGVDGGGSSFGFGFGLAAMTLVASSSIIAGAVRAREKIEREFMRNLNRKNDAPFDSRIITEAEAQEKLDLSASGERTFDG
jgi:hypothetical protein